MIFSEEPENKNDTALWKVYDSFGYNDKSRCKEILTDLFCISDSTFYKWLSNPELIDSPVKKRKFSVVFNKEIKELFPR